MGPIIPTLLLSLAGASLVNAYWLMGINNFIATERMDPIVDAGEISAHAHSIFGGSNFGFNVTTAQLRKSECTSVPIRQDNSIYWMPHLYFQWANGSFTSLSGGAVVYYLFSDTPGTTTPFPDDFRMLTGDTTLRSYNASSFAQQAVTFLCLDFDGTSTRHNEIPTTGCQSGIRAQINFPSCWDGKNVDSADHKSHVSFPSGGPDSGTCNDKNFPVTLPRVFMEVYWSSNTFDRSQGLNTTQPFVFANGDPTGYGYHADFMNGWDTPTLQKAVDGCHCNPSGDPTCCVDAGIFDIDTESKCYITPQVDEVVLGTLDTLPGNNPVSYGPQAALALKSTRTPATLSPVTVYTGPAPPAGACALSSEPSVVPSDQDYGYQGCIVDASPRTLSNTLQPANKTIDGCITAAKSAGFKYAGMEYGAECYAANELVSGRLATDDGRCSMPCADNPQQICGGPDGISMYAVGAKPNITATCTRSSSTGNSTSSSGTTTPSTIPSPSSSSSLLSVSSGTSSPSSSSLSVPSGISSPGSSSPSVSSDTPSSGTPSLIVSSKIPSPSSSSSLRVSSSITTSTDPAVTSTPASVVSAGGDANDSGDDDDDDDDEPTCGQAPKTKPVARKAHRRHSSHRRRHGRNF